MKVMFDANVLIDVVEKREPHFSDSYQVFMKGAKKEIEAIIGAGSTFLPLLPANCSLP